MARFTVIGPKGARRELEAEAGASLLRVLLDAGIDVPHLCYHESLSAYGACRLCLVEVVKGNKRTLTTSCNYPVRDGIEVHHDTDKVVRNRKMVLELTLAKSPGIPALLDLAEAHGLKQDEVRFPLDRENDCILCGLCERVCREAVGAEAITFSQRGDRKEIQTPFAIPTMACIGCASCAHICPTGHIVAEETPLWTKIWGRQFKKVLCSRCGAPLVTEAQRDHLVERRGFADDYFELCDTCKRTAQAAHFATVGK